MTTVKTALLSWASEVKQCLGGRFALAALAKEIEVNRATLHRYLNGEHQPTAGTITKVNDAVARLCKDPAIAIYLACVAVDENLLDVKALNAQTLLNGVIDALRSLGSYYLIPDFEERLETLTMRWNVDQLKSFVVSMNRTHRKLVLDAARGKDSRRSRYDAIRKVLERYGLEALLRSSSDVSALAIEAFMAIVHDALDQIAAPDISAPQLSEVERKIEHAATQLYTAEQSHSLRAALRKALQGTGAGHKRPRTGGRSAASALRDYFATHSARPKERRK